MRPERSSVPSHPPGGPRLGLPPRSRESPAGRLLTARPGVPTLAREALPRLTCVRVSWLRQPAPSSVRLVGGESQQLALGGAGTARPVHPQQVVLNVLMSPSL